MKIKYIFIVIMIAYIVLFLGSTIVELVMVDNTSRDIQLMVKTAAQMALQQTQATDDYFVTGGGYLSVDGAATDNDFSLKLLNGTEDAFVEGNIYQVYANSTDINEVYRKVYNAASLDNFLETPGVTNICFLGAVNSLNGGLLSRQWVAVPSLLQLGANSFNDASPLMTFKNPLDGSVASLSGGAEGQIMNSYALNNAAKQASVNGEFYTYYNTPLSLGITYLNEDILAANFVQNMDFLMRGKYEDLSTGEGVCTTQYYPELVDKESLKSVNPIHNGAFTFLRGKKVEGSSPSYSIYEGIKPRITYYVVDLYNLESADSPQNRLIRQVVGPSFTSLSKAANEAEGYSAPSGIVYGSALKQLNLDAVNSYKNMVGVGGDNTLFDHKFCVIAKVDFYAAVLVPYRTPFIRELKGREAEDGTVSGRHLLNAFSASGTYEAYKSLPGNYVAMDTRLADEDFEGYGDYINSAQDIYGAAKVPDGVEADLYVYTTYFAVLP